MSERQTVFAKCKRLSFIADEMDFGRTMLRLLEKAEIETIDDFLDKSNVLRKHAMTEKDASCKKKYKQLIEISRYAQHVLNTHGDVENFETVFSEEGFELFEEKTREDMEKALENACFGNKPNANCVSNDDLTKYIKKLVSAALQKLSPQCLDELQKCHLEPGPFMELLLRNGVDGTKYIVVEGRTQLGKSNVKCLVHAYGMVSKTATIVLTKGNRERDELLGKIKKHAGEKPLVINAREKASGIAAVFASAGTVVAAQTSSQIKSKLISVVQKCKQENPAFRFAVVLDEGDTMFRSREEDPTLVQVEQAYRDLLALNPAVVVMISATIAPMLLHLVDKEDLQKEGEGSRKIQFRLLKPNSNYVSIEDQQPMKDDSGASMYLDKPIRYKQGRGSYIGKVGPIPYTDEEGKMISFYKDALQIDPLVKPGNHDEPCEKEPTPKRPKTLNQGQRRGVLLLSVTNLRVYAEDNVFTMAKKVQNGFFKAAQKQMIVIVYVGKGIYTRYDHKTPGFVKAEDRGVTISDVIQSIDDNPDYGLKTPIFVFGFSQMMRGVSFRSAKRVPTHLVMSRSLGYSIEDVIQTLGRATFVGRDVLEENGFEQVKVLATAEDLLCATKYHVMTEFLQRRMLDGDTLYQALTGENEKIPDHANALKHTNRKIGPGARKNTATQRIMEARGVLGEHAFGASISVWSELGFQKYLRSVCRLWKDKPSPFGLKELQDAFKGDWGHDVGFQEMNTMVEASISFNHLTKEDNGDHPCFRVKNLVGLESLLQEELVEMSCPLSSPAVVSPEE